MEESKDNQENSIEYLLNEVVQYVYKDQLEDLVKGNCLKYNQIWSGPLSYRVKKLTSWILQEEEKNASFGNDWSSNGRLGPHCVDFNKRNCIGSFSFHDNPLQLTSVDNFSTGFANTCVFSGKWQYEVMLCTKGVMQIGWATGKCKFSHEKGVGDTPDSYAYDGKRQRRWNVATYKYGEIWSTGDVISCTIDLIEGKLTYFRNGRSLGEAFGDVRCGPGIAYFPALSLAIDESLIVNFGNTPFRYPQPGFLPMMAPQTRACLCAKMLLGFLRKLIDLTDIWLKDITDSIAFKNSNSTAALQIVAQYIAEELASYICQPYIVDQVFLPFLEELAPFQAGVFTPTQNTEKAHSIFDFLFSMLQEEEMMAFSEALINCLESWHRRVPQELKFSFQNYSLQMLHVILTHQKMRKFCLSATLFENDKFAQFMTIECVDLSILRAEFDINYWSNKTGAYKCGYVESYKNVVSTLQQSVRALESLQITILELMLTVDDEAFYKSSRFIFLNKLRLFLFNQSTSGRAPSVTSIPISTSMNLCERMFEAFSRLWKAETGDDLTEGSISPRMFYNGSVNYFDSHRLGGLDSHLRKAFSGEIDQSLRNEDGSNLLSLSVFPFSSSIDEPSTSAMHEGSYGRKSQELLKAESRRGLEHLFDSIVMLYHNSAHKLVIKVIAQTELMFDNVDYYEQLLVKKEKVSQGGSSIVQAELESSLSVLTTELKEQMYQHAWNEVRIINPNCFKKILNMLTLINGLMLNSSKEGPLFSFVPDFYVETIALLCQNLRLLVVVLDSDSDDLEIRFLGGLHMEDGSKKDYLKLLHDIGEFLSGHFCDSRIVYADSKDSLIQTIASFVCYKPGLRAIENMKEESRLAMIKHFLQPYEKGAWAQKNWILVQFWKGKGFGFRFTKSPHLSVKLGPKPSHSDINSIMPNSAPCPSDVFLGHVSIYLQNGGEESTKFMNSLLNQLNWAFSEFIGMLQEIQNASNRPERIFIDSRHLRICATCFDLTLALLRVLEMVVGVAPQLFLDSSMENSKSLLCRLCQLVCQVLNRTSFSSGCFGHVVNLDIPGLDAIHYYPILTAVSGILVNLLNADIHNSTDSNYSATNTLLREASFQLSSLCALVGIDALMDTQPLQLYSVGEAKFSLSPELEDDNSGNFSLLQYAGHVNKEEMQSIIDIINHLQVMIRAGVNQEKSDNDQFCTICYANMPNAVFYPCKHVSCVNCISHYLMNRTDCFFCKTQIQQVVNEDTGACIFTPTPQR